VLLLIMAAYARWKVGGTEARLLLAAALTVAVFALVALG